MYDATRCTFAFPGTYGHSCGAPAIWVRPMPSDVRPGTTYYARRCAKCVGIVGGENRDAGEPITFDPALHVR